MLSQLVSVMHSCETSLVGNRIIWPNKKHLVKRGKYFGFLSDPGSWWAAWRAVLEGSRVVVNKALAVTLMGWLGPCSSPTMVSAAILRPFCTKTLASVMEF